MLLPKKITILPLQIEHIGYLKNLPFHHRDPLDRMIIAQASVENFTIMSDDGFFKFYDVPILNN
jgi:PIN domain nuclease of toxin-antitoxin system